MSKFPYIFEMPIKVRDYEVDGQGIVNNANYQHYLEHTRHEWAEQAGLSFGEMHLRGIDPVVRKVEIEYLTSLRMGDTMISRLALERSGAKFIFHQDIFTPDGRQVIRGRVTIVVLEDGKLTRGDILEKTFEPYLVKTR